MLIRRKGFQVLSFEGFTSTENIIKWLAALDGQKVFAALINENRVQKQGERALEDLRSQLQDKATESAEAPLAS